MGNKVFVGGLSWGTEESTLREECSRCGEIVDVKIIMDRETGKSRGFGFVTFANSEGAKNAILNINQQELDGRRITVSEAQERKPREDSDGRREFGNRRW